jgi:hypothetical protein
MVWKKLNGQNPKELSIMQAVREARKELGMLPTEKETSEKKVANRIRQQISRMKRNGMKRKA